MGSPSCAGGALLLFLEDDFSLPMWLGEGAGKGLTVGADGHGVTCPFVLDIHHDQAVFDHCLGRLERRQGLPVLPLVGLSGVQHRDHLAFQCSVRADRGYD